MWVIHRELLLSGSKVYLFCYHSIQKTTDVEKKMQNYLFEEIQTESKCNHKRKCVIDDGFNAELVKNSIFTGLLEIPLIKKPREFIVPKSLIPFSECKNSKTYKEFVCFYEHDKKFRDILNFPEEQIYALKKFQGVISPDCSLYYDMPLVLQMTNTYLNRQIGHYLQSQGIYVIPNVRWGYERSYKRIILTELPFAFLGLEKQGIYSIGTYGCCKKAEYKYHLREGLRSFIKEIEPKIILVYGAMPDSVFTEFKKDVQFIQYDNWTKLQHNKGDKHNGEW